MFDSTHMLVDKTITDIKRAVYACNVLFQCVYIGYLLFAILAATGILAINIILLAISVAYFVFFLVTTSFGKTPDGKELRKTVARIFKWCKILIKPVTLGFAFYGIYTADGNAASISIILTILMLLGWILQIVFEVLVMLVEIRVEQFKAAVSLDVEKVLAPFKQTGNFFKRLAGKEVEEVKRTPLQEKILAETEVFVQEKNEKKAQEKALKALERANKKAEAKARKISMRKTKQILKNDKKKNKTAETEVAFGEEE